MASAGTRKWARRVRRALGRDQARQPRPRWAEL